MKVLMIIPAYNEAENIAAVIRHLAAEASEVDYVVVNDCSKDSTAAVCKENGFHLISLPINLGIGGGVQTGYLYALEKGYDIAVQFDGDGQHDAAYIKDLIAPIESGQADVVIGSRFVENKGFQSSAARRFGIRFLSGLIKLLCGVRVRDVTSGMRAVNRGMIEKFAQNYAQDYPEPEAILFSALAHARIMEVPVQMRERQGGTSSINLVRSMYYMVKVSIALMVARVSMRGECG